MMTIKVNCPLFSYRSPYLQLNYDERHPEVFMKYSAPEIHQCNDSSKHYLTQSMTQNACELRILTDDSLQSLGADLREQSPCWKSVTISKTLNHTLIQEIQVACWIHVKKIQSKVHMSPSNVDFLMIIYIIVRYDSLNSNYKLCYKHYVHITDKQVKQDELNHCN